MKQELTDAQTALIAATTQGADTEWRGYAEEMACQYGADYLDDDATVLSMRAVDLVNMMAVLGYRKPDRDAEIAALRKDAERLDYLQGQTVDTVYFDDGEILDVGGKHATHLREAIDAAMARAAALALARQAWNQAYAAHLLEAGGMPLADGLAMADSADDFFNDGASPLDAADEEMSCWGD